MKTSGSKGNQAFQLTIGMLVFVVITITIVYGIGMNQWKSETVTHKRELQDGQWIVSLNEVEQLLANNDQAKAVSQIHTLQSEMREDRTTNENTPIKVMTSMYVFFLVILILTLLLLYWRMFRPFYRMEKYASEIAKGNLSFPIHFERTNLFGSFTWAFDHMKQEITRARDCEREAVENNKTVIATLSHDIKTPIASIRAYAEGLEANLDRTPERRQRYIQTIMSKCDEVTGLTNDLFLHSLSELNRLTSIHEPVEMTGLLRQTVEDMQGEANDIDVIVPDQEIWINGDARRIAQVYGNLINNSRKYANSRMTVEMKQEGQMLTISFRDYGPGIPPEDMPFVKNQFYRGGNIQRQEGAGLGLYIADYIIKQHGGTMELLNQVPGLNIIITMRA